MHHKVYTKNWLKPHRNKSKDRGVTRINDWISFMEDNYIPVLNFFSKNIPYNTTESNFN